MNIQQIPEADYLDLLFDGRNKAYGAFELRRHYARRTRRALGAIVTITALLAAYPLFADKDHRVTELIIPVTVNPKIVTLPDAKKVEIPKPEVKLQPTASTAITLHIMVDPEVVVDQNVMAPIRPADSLGDRKIGLTDNPDGDANGLDPNPGQKKGSGTITALVDQPAAGLPHTYDLDAIDQRPEFNGNLSAWLEDHLDYPEEARAEGYEGKVEIQFVVDEHGAISDVSVLSGSGHGLDVEGLRVIKMMPLWKPGKLNGKPVRAWFKLPIAFTLNG